MTNKSTVKTWRERIGAGPEFPLHAPTDVERAMEAEIAELRGAQQDGDAQLDKMWKARFMIGQALHNVMVGNQSAWIEWKHGAGAESAMQWIENGLIGPGLIPSGTEAQAWFDANQDDRYEIPPRPVTATAQHSSECTCPSGDGSLRWPCPAHPPEHSDQKGGAA